MTLVWESDPAQPGGPRTHVLLIGVGHYRHMPGGAEERAERDFTVDQVDSPPLSAQAMVDFLLTEYGHPTAPLGSVEVVASEQPGPVVVAGVPVAAATRSGVRTAYQAWRARCDTDPGNVAIFYFCGHGVALDNHYLLLEDVGAYPGAPLENSIDLIRFYRGMTGCPARVQVFLVDACRDVPRLLVQIPDPQAERLADYRVNSPGGRDAPILRATADKKEAVAPRGEITRFTHALLRGLRGIAATRTAPGGADWVVQFRDLAEKVRLQLQADGHGQECRIGGDGFDPTVARLTRTPVVPLAVTVVPDTVAELRLGLPSGEATPYRREPGLGRWSVDVPAGTYVLEARFARPDIVMEEQGPLEVAPPNRDVSVAVRW